MKKVMLSIMVVAGLGTALVSCKEEAPVTPAEPGTATISGVAEADLETLGDTTDLGAYVQVLEKVPAGTKIYFTYDSGSLDPDRDFGYNYDEIVVVAEVDANGEYSVELPAIGTAHNVEVSFADFAYDQKVPEVMDSTVDYTTERVIFTKANETVSVQENSNIILDVVFN